MTAIIEKEVVQETYLDYDEMLALWNINNIESIALDAYYEINSDEDMRITAEMMSIFNAAANQVTQELRPSEYVSLVFKDAHDVFLIQVQNLNNGFIRYIPLLTNQNKISNDFHYGYRDDVKVRCSICEKIHANRLYYDFENSNYPEDFFIECQNCDNMEEGNANLQSFALLEYYQRV